MRTFSIVILAALAVVGAVLGYRVLAGNADEPVTPHEPETATPPAEEEGGYWTPERLKEARPIDMPVAPGSLVETEEPGSARPDPTQSGAGSAGSGDVAPEQDMVLIPGLSKPDTTDK